MSKIMYMLIILNMTIAIYCSPQKVESPIAPIAPIPSQQTPAKIIYKNIIVAQAGCIAGDMQIILPRDRDFTFICNKDYRGKGQVIIKADPKTGNPVEIYVQTPLSNTAVSQPTFGDISLVKFITLGSITKKTPLAINYPTKKAPVTGYVYKPSTGELAGKNIYILVRYYNENNQEGVRFYRSLNQPGPKVPWTEFWSTEGLINTTDNKEITAISILPDGNCEINLPGWLPIVLPLGTKELSFKSHAKSPLKS